MPLAAEIKVLSVDDHSLVRDGIAFAIQSQPDMMMVAEAADGREAIAMFRQHRPDVTLMDLHMPVMNGIEATAEIKRIAPLARVLVLTTYSEDMQARRHCRRMTIWLREPITSVCGPRAAPAPGASYRPVRY